MATLLRALLVLSTIAASATSAVACPLCATGTGDAVRAGIAADFVAHLGATAAPFVVLFLVVTIVQRGWPPWGGGT